MLADCEPVLHQLDAIVMDLHDSTRRATGAAVLELLARNGFIYAVDEFVPQPWRHPSRRRRRRFPARLCSGR